MIKYSFVIPVKEINGYTRESVPKILETKRDDYEIILYPDFGNASNEIWPKTRQIESPRGPAIKRSLAMRDARGEILVFIDDDAYPRKNFLDILDKNFSNEDIVAVGGPAVTPDNDGFWQKVSGAVFLSSLSGGFPERYASIGNKKFVDDWPSVNFSVRRAAFEKVGGFDSEYWPGEDTKFCLDLIKEKKTKILYDPELIVCHHRRSGLIKHLKQIGGYGLHRGFFAKKYPETSLKFKYFIPSCFALFVFFGWIAGLVEPFFIGIYLFGLAVYGLALIKALFDIKKYEKSFLVAVNALYYIFFTHLFYGLKFIQGFVFTKELKSKLR